MIKTSKIVDKFGCLYYDMHRGSILIALRFSLDAD